MAEPRICVLVTRHEMEPRQLDDLRARMNIDKFVTLDGVYGTGFKVWEAILTKCGAKPALIVAVLPDHILMQLLFTMRDSDNNIDIWEADMIKYGEDWVWTGSWDKLVGFRHLRVPVPERNRV